MLYSLIIISIFLACYDVAKNEKNCPFVGAPVRPNMLNMPESTSGDYRLLGPKCRAPSNLSICSAVLFCAEKSREIASKTD